jgi:hypothetical protein
MTHEQGKTAPGQPPHSEALGLAGSRAVGLCGAAGAFINEDESR